MTDELWKNASNTLDPDGCWPWVGPLSGAGYGLYRGKHAHRATFAHAYGKIAPGLVIHHNCETKACVNPAHLEAMTPSQHTRRHRPRTPVPNGGGELNGLQEVLAAARERSGLSVPEAAAIAGVAPSYWQYLEWNRRNPPTVPTLRRILAAVNLDPDATLRECGLL